MIVYADWKEITYSIYYYSNFGENEFISKDYIYDKEYSFGPNSFIKKGNSFISWNTNSDGSGLNYDKKNALISFLDIEGAVVRLYAQWEAITFTIAYEGNKNTDGSMEMSEIKYDVYSILSANTFIREGYYFDGWMFNRDGEERDFTDREDIANLYDYKVEKIIYAKWVAKSYDIIFNYIESGSDKEDYTLKMTDSKEINYSVTYNENYKLAVSERISYKFLDWFHYVDGKGKEYKGPDAKGKSVCEKFDADKYTVYADWELVIYELELVNEIKGISRKLKYNYEESYDVFENSLLEDKYILGYRFNRWIDETGGVLKTSLPIKSVGNRTLKADFLGKESDYEKNKSDYKQMEGILSIRFNGADKGQQGAILYIENDYDEITLIGKSENVVGSLELINFQIVVKYRTTPVTIRFCNLKTTALKGCNTVNTISGADKVTIISHGTNYIIGGEGTTGAKGIKGANMSQAAAGADGADNKEGWYINPDGDNGQWRQQRINRE